MSSLPPNPSDKLILRLFKDLKSRPPLCAAIGPWPAHMARREVAQWMACHRVGPLARTCRIDSVQIQFDRAAWSARLICPLCRPRLSVFSWDADWSPTVMDDPFYAVLSLERIYDTLEGWLQLAMFIGQCRTCKTVFWWN